MSISVLVIPTMVTEVSAPDAPLQISGLRG